MALEQLKAFSQGISQDKLGPVETIGLDNFALLKSSELKDEHEVVSKLIKAAKPEIDYAGIKNFSAFARAVHAVSNLIGISKELESKKDFELLILESDQPKRTNFYLAFLERISWYELRLFSCSTDRYEGDYFFRDGCATKYLLKLIKAGVNMNVVAKPTFEWIAIHRYFYYVGNHTEKFIDLFFPTLLSNPLLDELKSVLITIRSTLYDESHSLPTVERMIQKVDELLGEGVWQEVFPVEVWAESATKEYFEMPQSEKDLWLQIFKMCRKVNTSKPTKKWLKEGQRLIDTIGVKEFRQRVLNWFILFEEGSSSSLLAMRDQSAGSSRLIVNETNSRVIRGLVFLCIHVMNEDTVKAVGRLALSAYRKIPNVGARSMKIGNAAVYTLSQVASNDAVAQLAILDSKLRGMSILKGIEKAQNLAAVKAGVSPSEIEEMSVPNFGLERGKLETKLGEFTIEVLVNGLKAIVHYKNEAGREIKSVPTVLKQDFAAELKAIKNNVKDIESMLSAQITRIEQLFLENKNWSYKIWRERYLEHALVGTIATRLIWNFNSGDKQNSGIFHNGQIIDSEGKELLWLDDTTIVSIWHPVLESPQIVSQWRDLIVGNQIRQPFKQAHREIYLVTDAERITNIYSNRFAAHILKQNQFKALTEARKWKSIYRLQGVDQGSEPAHKFIASYAIRAEFFVEGVDDYSNEYGAYRYLATDQVRFYNASAEVIPIADVPAVVFSEVMRDIDLFVGVTSIGNDPDWLDGGADNQRFNHYWNDYAFGELNVSAKFRKAALEMIIPKMRIADKCTFTEKYLIVKGSLRTYKIHFGSGNILMDPGDQYLCIVPKPQKLSEQVFLPFEGDMRLSVILSKAIMLADDKNISDPTITGQIGK